MNGYVIENYDGTYVRLQPDCGGYDIELVTTTLNNATLYSDYNEAQIECDKLNASRWHHMEVQIKIVTVKVEG